MKRSKAEKKIRKYLEDLHVTLWSDFDLHRPDSFEKAVEWFLDQVTRAGLVSDKEPQGDSTGVVMTPLGPIYPKPELEVGEVLTYNGQQLEVIEITKRGNVTDVDVKPLYPKCNDLNCKDGLDEHSHSVVQSAEEAALDMSGPPEETSQIAFDSGFVTYKDAVTCTCEDQIGSIASYRVVDPNCPIHGPHAFPWRKSR
jgi:hypothetical protein